MQRFDSAAPQMISNVMLHEMFSVCNPDSHWTNAQRFDGFIHHRHDMPVGRPSGRNVVRWFSDFPGCKHRDFYWTYSPETLDSLIFL